MRFHNQSQFNWYEGHNWLKLNSIALNPPYYWKDLSPNLFYCVRRLWIRNCSKRLPSTRKITLILQVFQRIDFFVPSTSGMARVCLGSGCSSSNKYIKVKGKLYFTVLNYVPYYTLYHKLFECTICTLNYDIHYTLHSAVSFTIQLDGNSTWLAHALLSCTNLKDQIPPLSNQLKTFFFFLFLHIRYQPLSKILATLNPLGIITAPPPQHLLRTILGRL